MFGEVIGVNFSFNEDEELKNIKDIIEKETNYVVYYGIYTDTAFGRMIDLLCVTTYEDDWEQAYEDIYNGYAEAYCYNLDEKFGEYGSIGFELANGGLIRTG